MAKDQQEQSPLPDLSPAEREEALRLAERQHPETAPGDAAPHPADHELPKVHSDGP